MNKNKEVKAQKFVIIEYEKPNQSLLQNQHKYSKAVPCIYI